MVQEHNPDVKLVNWHVAGGVDVIEHRGQAYASGPGAGPIAVESINYGTLEGQVAPHTAEERTERQKAHGSV